MCRWVKVYLQLETCFVADTMEEAKEKAGEHMVNYMRWVCHWRGLGNHMDPGEELPVTPGKLDLLNYEFLHKKKYAIWNSRVCNLIKFMN